MMRIVIIAPGRPHPPAHRSKGGLPRRLRPRVELAGAGPELAPIERAPARHRPFVGRDQKPAITDAVDRELGRQRFHGTNVGAGCAWRKPRRFSDLHRAQSGVQPEALNQGRRDHGASLSRSWMVSDAAYHEAGHAIMASLAWRHAKPLPPQPHACRQICRGQRELHLFRPDDLPQ